MLYLTSLDAAIRGEKVCITVDETPRSPLYFVKIPVLFLLYGLLLESPLVVRILSGSLGLLTS